jgi:hypothetical protein
MKYLLPTALLLVGCAHACPKVAPPQVVKTIVEQQPVNHYIVVREPPAPHQDLIQAYSQSLSATPQIVEKAPAPTVDCLTKLTQDARTAFRPVMRRGHRATPDELAKAKLALNALDAGIELQACPKH